MDTMVLERISKVIQTEATTPSIGDFLLTHVPFENLFLENGKSISENELLTSILLKNRNEHKFIMVQGGNGSGKSHLIRWLKEKYINVVDNEKEAVLLISRAHNTLQDALTQLLESDIFPQEIKENELKHIKNAKSNITGEELNKTINFNFTLEIDADESNQNAILDMRIRKWLSVYLNDNYIKSEFLLTPNGPIERIRAKIETTNEDTVNHNEDPMFSSDDFNITIAQIRQKLNVSDGRAADFTIRLAEKFTDIRNGAELRQKVADYLNTKVSNVIQRSMKLQTADFKKLFAALRKILKQENMNLTLFVEDINSFTGIDEALMEVLLTDHTAEGNQDYCRIISVVGSTNWFFNNKLNASIRERIKTNIFIEERSVLGSKEHLAKFAAKYINAINLTDEEIKNWADNGANDDELPRFECGHEWANIDCNSVKLSIFPFNDTSLWKLYGTLSPEKKTPRVFLKSVIAHTLKLWCTNPEGLLSNENNFSNADISMPRWESQLYNQANLSIDENSAIERGILLRLWGDGTAKSDNGTLGGLTADVFKAFNVYANITGEPKPIAKTKVNMESHIVNEKPTAASAPIISKHPRLNEIEIDLENWLRSNDNSTNKLKSHAELRELVKNFIISSINWESESVSTVLVSGYMTLKRLFIENQLSTIGEGLILSRSEETSYLLLALANWKYQGANSWNFDEGEDYLVLAITWLEKYKNDIIKSIVAPKDRYDIWNLPLWNVSALYCIKTLFGGLDISKSSEDIAVELLGSSPNFTEQTTHSMAWQELQKIVLKQDCYKVNLIEETFAYFSKSVGNAKAGETKYVFIDVFELLNHIRKLKSLQWNLEGLCPMVTETSNNTWYYSINLIRIFLDNISRVVEDENEKANYYLDFFAQIFDNDFNEPTVSASLQATRDFLTFLTNHLNLSYEAEDYKIIKPSTAASKLVAALNKVQRLGENQKASETLMKISKNPFDDIEKFHYAFLAFNKLLNDKENIFSSYVDTESKQAIVQYKEDIVCNIDNILVKITQIGGSANGTY